MKLRIILLGVLLAAVILTGCKPAATPTAAPSSPSGNQGGYPAPQQLQAKPAQSTGPLYPDVKNGSEVSWDQAAAMILNGEAKQLIVDKSLKVTLLLKDGRSITSKALSQAQVTEIVKTCGDLCKDINVQNQ